MQPVCSSYLYSQRIHLVYYSLDKVSHMPLREVSRALDEIAAIIAKVQFIAAELHQAKQLELKRQRELRQQDKDE